MSGAAGRRSPGTPRASALPGVLHQALFHNMLRFRRCNIPRGASGHHESPGNQEIRFFHQPNDLSRQSLFAWQSIRISQVVSKPGPVVFPTGQGEAGRREKTSRLWQHRPVIPDPALGGALIYELAWGVRRERLLGA